MRNNITWKFVKNTPLRVVFSTLLSVFHLVMKHCISCLIYYITNFLWACRNRGFSLLLVAGDFSQWGTSETQGQKFHADDVNQCLQNESSSHGFPNANLFNFTFLMVDFVKVLCSSENELQQNSNTSPREEYCHKILSVLL